MNRSRGGWSIWSKLRDLRRERRGTFTVLATTALLATTSMLALGVDLAVISLARTRMQNAVDAAALAAAQEITTSLETAANSVNSEGNVSGQIQDANAIAVGAAKAMAEKVAGLNGVYVNKDRDVTFGKRVFDTASQKFIVQWGVSPYNVVKVTALKTNPVESAPDARLQLFFAKVFGKKTVDITVSAVAFVEARDIVLVLDYSASMSYDSDFTAMASNRLGKSAVESNLDDIWSALTNSDVRYSNKSTRKKFPSTGFGKINSATGTYVSSDYSSSVFNSLNLDDTNSDGTPKYPFPQEGKYSSGNLKGMPTGTTNRDLWLGYIDWVRTNSTVNTYGYRKRYGYRTLMAYLISQRVKNNQSEDLWRAPIYPIQALKDGVSLFTEFLDGLEFGDHLGLVIYDLNSRVETGLSDPGYSTSVNLGSNPITKNYSDINTIVQHKQAGHYDIYTATGAGIADGRELLASYGRYGARPTMLIMTDGNANQSPSTFKLPSDWSWSALTDYTGSGVASYTTSDRHKQYAFYQAKLAIDAGYTVHTLTVGEGADRDLMKAIAFAGKGVHFDVPGGATVNDMRVQMLAAFSKIAANVPPAKLAKDN